MIHPNINRINIRVYACILRNGHVMALHEEYAGEQLLKLPGGGLEYGEGVLDCLHREFEEELNAKIHNISHLYTQEEFVVSRFKDHEQLLTIYYTAELQDEHELLILDPCIESIEWIDLQTTENPFPLPVDQIAFQKLKEKYR